jgi:signal peptidase I
LRRPLVVLACVIGLSVVTLTLLASAGVLHLYRIASASMEPTLQCAGPAIECEARWSDRVVALRYVFGEPSRGDLVAFHTPSLTAVRCGAGGTFVKRVIGLPGDRVGERAGVVTVDGRPLREPYIPRDRRDSLTIAPVTVPAGGYFLLGDNRVASCDSRVWGTVARGAIIGRVVATYWPPGRAAFH